MSDYEEWSVWMHMPTEGGKKPFSRIAGGLTRDEAEWMADELMFEARAMPEKA